MMEYRPLATSRATAAESGFCVSAIPKRSGFMDSVRGRSKSVSSAYADIARCSGDAGAEVLGPCPSEKAACRLIEIGMLDVAVVVSAAAVRIRSRPPAPGT